MSEPIRVALSGAGGRIGYSLVFRIAAGGLFGAEHPVELSLLETKERMNLLEAESLELKDCAFPLLSRLRISSEPREAFEGADWVILVGGRGRRFETERRTDLLLANAPIFVEHGRAINESSPMARVLVVANPCNTNCYIAKAYAPNVPAEHWFAMNRLDRMRATSLIAEKAGVAVSHVNRVTIWGNHSNLVYPDLHNSFIDDRRADEVINDPDWARQVFEPTVAHRSDEVIKLCGASPAATAAQAILGTIHSITRPTPFERHFGAAVVSDGAYRVPRDLIFGFPLRTEDGKTWSIVHGMYLDSYAQERIAANIAELEHEAALVSALLP